MEEEKIFVEKEIEKLHHLVEETYQKHVNLGKENKGLSEKVEKQSQEIELYKAEILKKSNEIRDLMGKIDRERDEMREKCREVENDKREKIEEKKREFKVFEERMWAENQRNQARFAEELQREKNEFEGKNLEFANANKENLQELEEVLDIQEKAKEKMTSYKKTKDQNSLQEKSIKIALKELQEELMMGRVTNPNLSSKTPEALKNSINKKNKLKIQD